MTRQKATTIMALVRLKPLNPRAGFKLRRYSDVRLKVQIRGDRGWHTVSDSVARKLAEVCQNGNTRHDNELLGIQSAPAFDVAMTKDEARAIERRGIASAGRDAAVGSGRIDDPVPDFRPGRKPRLPAPPPPDDEGEEDGESEGSVSEDLLEARAGRIAKLVAEHQKAELQKILADEQGADAVPETGTKAQIAEMIVDGRDEAAIFDED